MIEIGMRDIILVTPIIILLLTGIIPITLKVLAGNKETSVAGTIAPAFLGLILASGLILVLNTNESQSIFGGTMVVDGLSAWISSLVLFLTAGVILLVKDSPSTPKNQLSEYIFLIMGSAIGMLILISAVDLITVFIGLETMSLALYIMIAISNEQKLAKEAAFKYFILGSFASAIFLYGVAFIFGSVGSTSLEQIAISAGELILSDRLFILGVLLVILAFGFKVSIFPFHAWTPDVYQGAPTPMTAYMSTAVKAVSMIAFFRFMATQSILGSDVFLDILQWLAVGTMFAGNVAALLQDNLKRMLAYSSVSHSGYMLMAIIVAATSTNHVASATQALVFYLFAYGFMTLGAFAIVSYFEKTENTLVHVNDLSGISQRFPLLSICFTLFLLSLAGIPPTVGFFGKLTLFSVVVAEGFYWMAIWGVVNSVISVFYYLRPVVAMYMRPYEKVEYNQKNWTTWWTIAISTLFVVIFGLMSSPLYEVARQASVVQ